MDQVYYEITVYYVRYDNGMVYMFQTSDIHAEVFWVK